MGKSPAIRKLEKKIAAHWQSFKEAVMSTATTDDDLVSQFQMYIPYVLTSEDEAALALAAASAPASAPTLVVAASPAAASVPRLAPTPSKKSAVAPQDRCVAAKCMRRKKAPFNFCGTHYKGSATANVTTSVTMLAADAVALTPVSHSPDTAAIAIPEVSKVAVFPRFIHNVLHYLDHKGCVYNTEDILRKIPNPAVVAHYVEEGGNYTIVAIKQENLPTLAGTAAANSA